MRFLPVEQNYCRNAPVVVLTTSETATSGVLAVLAYTTVTGRDVAAVLASVGEPRRHFLHRTQSGQRLIHPKSIRAPQDQSTAVVRPNASKTTSIGEHGSSRIQRGCS